MNRLDRFDIMSRYIVDRFRQWSDVLEPGYDSDPYLRLKKHAEPLDQALAQLYSIRDESELQDAIDRLLRGELDGSSDPEARLRVLTHALNLAPQIGTEYCLETLRLVPTALETIAESQDRLVSERQAILIGCALRIALHHDEEELLTNLVHQSMRIFEQKRDTWVQEAVAWSGDELFRSLIRLGSRERLRDFVVRLEQLAFKDCSIELVLSGSIHHRLQMFRSLLVVGSGWLALDEASRAGPILDAAHATLTSDRVNRRVLVAYGYLAEAYLRSLGHGHRDSAFNRTEAVFQRLWKLDDTFTTASHFSKFHVGISEAAVLAIVQASADAS